MGGVVDGRTIVDVTRDKELLVEVAASTECADVERLWARAALDRLTNHSVRGAVCVLQMDPSKRQRTGETAEHTELRAATHQRIMDFGCLLCVEPLLAGEAVLLWTTIHGVHRRCVEERFSFDTLPKEIDMPESISRLKGKGRLSA